MEHIEIVIGQIKLSVLPGSIKGDVK
jgi:hypothetical protein